MPNIYTQVDDVVIVKEIDDNDENSYVQYELGPVVKVVTERLNNTTVVDITSEFNFEFGKYYEQSRVEREEPLPPVPPTEAEKITQLEAENATLKARLSDVEMFVADMISGGGV
jgi:hypothetical protein